MNLVVDVGNTSVKLAVFSNNIIVKKKSVKLKYIGKHVDDLLNAFPEITSGVVSSVGKLDKSHIDKLKSKLNWLYLNSETKLPFTNNYKTPKTLGVDRIAIVSASVFHYPNNNVLIIDAGTCITFDFVTSKNEYLGGAISPGTRMRYKALNNFTANLPLLKKQKPDNLIGNSTESSMHSGVVNGVLNEIDGVISSYKLKYPDLTVILTGGDCKFLSKQLKSSIFANSIFLLEGLNYILEFNSN